jgi:hypothetical protein
MNIKDLEKAKKIYKKIKSLDREIISLEKIAKEIDRDFCNIQFKLENFKQKNDQESKDILDEDGSIVLHRPKKMPGIFAMLHGFDLSKTSKKEKWTSKTSFKISEELCYELLGVLLSKRIQERESLLNHLEKLGVS